MRISAIFVRGSAPQRRRERLHLSLFEVQFVAGVERTAIERDAETRCRRRGHAPTAYIPTIAQDQILGAQLHEALRRTRKLGRTHSKVHDRRPADSAFSMRA